MPVRDLAAPSLHHTSLKAGIEVESTTDRTVLNLQMPASHTSTPLQILTKQAAGTFKFVDMKSSSAGTAVSEFSVDGFGNVVAHSLKLDGASGTSLNGLTILHGGLSLPDGFQTITTAADNSLLALDATLATYSKTALNVKVNSAAGSAFKFISFQAQTAEQFSVDSSGAVTANGETRVNAVA